jgi:N-acetyl-gamma-glutamyl-phosphate reductase
LTVHAVSGYSGGGKALIKVFETEPHEPWGGYGYNLKHKHLPEMGKWSKLGKAPVFSPAVGDFAQGMVVTVPLHYSQLATPGGSAGGMGAALHAALAAHYATSAFVTVMPLNDTQHLERGAFLRPDAVNGTNSLQLFVFADDGAGSAMLCARLDNLGKGASGAAVQNLNLALGFPENAGLTKA